MSIKSRLPKIRQSVSQTQLCLKTSNIKSIWTVPSSSDPANSYQMIVKIIITGKIETHKGWVNLETIELTCNKVDAAKGWLKCKGQHSWNCYHSLGALLKQKPDIKLFDTFQEAKNNLLKNDIIIKIISSQNSSIGWGVMPPELTENQKTQKEIQQIAQDDPHLAKRLQRMNDRVEMMHGPVEEGIN